MKYLRTVTRREPEDVRWLNETHLNLLPPLDFASFVLSGNDDWPERLDLYLEQNPDYRTRPILVLVRDKDTGELMRAP